MRHVCVAAAHDALAQHDCIVISFLHIHPAYFANDQGLTFAL